MITQNLECFIGCDMEFCWRVVPPTYPANVPYPVPGSTPVNISGWTIFLTAKRNLSDPDSAAFLLIDWTILNGVNGIIRYTAPASVTSGWPLGNNIYGVKVIVKAGPQQPYVQGTLKTRYQPSDRVTP